MSKSLTTFINRCLEPITGDELKLAKGMARREFEDEKYPTEVRDSFSLEWIDWGLPVIRQRLMESVKHG